MFSHTIHQPNQQLQNSPLPPAFKFKSTLPSFDNTLTSSFTLIAEQYNHDPPYQQTIFNFMKFTPTRVFLNQNISALYHQENLLFQSFQNIVPFTLKCTYNKT